MWFFEKKVTEEEFSKFQKQVQKSFQKVKADNRDLGKQLTVLTKVTMALSPLSKRFTEPTEKSGTIASSTERRKETAFRIQ